MSNQRFVCKMKRRTKRERRQRQEEREIKRVREREREGWVVVVACGRTEKDTLKSFKLFFPLNNPSFVQI